MSFQVPLCTEWPSTQMTGEGPVCSNLHGGLQALTGRLGGATISVGLWGYLGSHWINQVPKLTYAL
jgi:hypothetical protein